VLPVITPREAAAQLHRAVGEGLRTGLLFGGERAGLETQDIALCQAIVTIPIDPRFRSLNLAQAVAINAYEWRIAQGDRPPPAFREGAPTADQAMLDGLYGHLEGELQAAGFFHPPEKKPSMVRNLRAIFARARLNEQEVRTLRGVVTALSRGRGQVLAKLAAKKAGTAERKTAEVPKD
jgi:tRNA/rRNA methyltransferase